jgi:hypothetical protein
MQAALASLSGLIPAFIAGVIIALLLVALGAGSKAKPLGE